MAVTPISVGITVGATGAQPTPPAFLNATLINYATMNDPGLTILPAALIEDIASTDTAALVLIDQCAVDLINSITPYSSNQWLLTQQGNMVGVQLGLGSNGSAFVVFTGNIGFVIPQGWIVLDASGNQYIIQDGGVIGSGSVSPPLFAVSTTAGTFPIPANTINSIVSVVPTGITISVTNPTAGTPSTGLQTEAQYRAQVLQAWRASAQGMATYLKSQLALVSGVQPRLVSVIQQVGGWEVIVGGGDPYQVANAIFTALFDITSLVGSTMAITGITNASPGVATVDINHGFTEGQNNVHIAGVVGTSGVNGGPYTVHVVSENQFSFGVNTTSSGTYVSGGVVTPNNRNLTVNLIDPPNTYNVIFVIPPQETVTISMTWNTSSPNVVSNTAVAQLGGPAIANYINSIGVGQPINVFEMEVAFQAAIESLFDIQYLEKMSWTVSINSIVTAPLAGTFLIFGDPESYFFTTPSSITITQG